MNSSIEKDFQSNNSEDAPLRVEEEEKLGQFKTLYLQETNKKQKIDAFNPSEDSSKKSTKFTKDNSDNIENKEKSNINSSPDNNSEVSKKKEIISFPLIPFQNSYICEKNNLFLGKKIKDSGNCKEKQSQTGRKAFGCDEIKNNPNQEREKKGMFPKENFGDKDDILNPNEFNYESNIKDYFLEEKEKIFLEEEDAFKEKQNAFIAQIDEKEKKTNIPYFYFLDFGDHFQVLPFKKNNQ